MQVISYNVKQGFSGSDFQRLYFLDKMTHQFWGTGNARYGNLLATSDDWNEVNISQYLVSVVKYNPKIRVVFADNIEKIREIESMLKLSDITLIDRRDVIDNFVSSRYEASKKFLREKFEREKTTKYEKSIEMQNMLLKFKHTMYRSNLNHQIQNCKKLCEEFNKLYTPTHIYAEVPSLIDINPMFNDLRLTKEFIDIVGYHVLKRAYENCATSW